MSPQLFAIVGAARVNGSDHPRNQAEPSHNEQASTPWCNFRALTSYLDSHPTTRPYFRWVEPRQPASPSSAHPCVTFGHFRQLSLRLAHVLSSRYQIGKGDVIIIDLEPGMDFFLSFIACLYIGAIAVPVYPPNGAKVSIEIKKMGRIVQDVLNGLSPNTNDKVFLLTSRLTDMVFTYSRGFGLLVAAESWEKHVKRITLPSFSREDGTIEDLEPAWPLVGANDVAFLQYTSGSTGDPKGVIITHGQLSAQVWFGMNHYQLTPSDVFLSWMPQYHDFGLISNFCYTLATGCEFNIMSPITFLKDPIFWIQKASELHATVLTAPNFAYGHTLKRFYALPRGPNFHLDLSSCRILVSGAEPVNIQLMNNFLEYFAHYGLQKSAFISAYGLAEHVILVCGGRPGEDPTAKAIDKRVSVGSSAGNFVDIRIIDPDTAESLPDGRVGEIWVNSPSKAGGYWGRPELSRDVFFARFTDGDGMSKSSYLRTGDLGFKLGSDLYFAGRLKDTMKINGRNVFPNDIEQFAVSCKQVASATRPGSIIAFQIPHPSAEGADNGCLCDNVVVVVSELATTRGHTLENLDFLCASMSKNVLLHTDVRPYTIVLVEPKTLPKTTSGKIRRQEARRRFIAGEMELFHTWRQEAEEAASANDECDSGINLSVAASGSECSLPEDASTCDVVCRLLRGVLRIPSLFSIEHTDGILALGLESMTFAALVARLEDHFHIKLHSMKISDVTSVRDLSVLIDAVKSGSAPQDPLGFYSDDTWDFPRDTVVSPESVGKLFPCSSAQRRVFYAQEYSGRTSYHVPELFHLKSHCNPESLAEAAKLAIQQHSAFRTAFVKDENGRLMQKILPETQVRVGIEKYTELDWSSRLAEFARIDNLRPMKAEAGEVARIRVFDLGHERGVAMYVNIHHYIIDSWSAQILFNDINKAYRGLSEHGCYVPTNPSHHYADFALWENALLEAKSETLSKAEARFWKSAVEDLSPLSIPPASADSSAPRHIHQAEDVCDATTLERFLNFGRRHNCTPFVSLLSVFLLLVSNYSGQDEFTVATPLSRRDVPELLEIFGIITNTVILPVKLGDKFKMTLDDLVLNVREMFRRVAANSVTPLEAVSAAVANLSNGEINLASHCRALFVYNARENLDSDNIFFGKEQIIFPIEEFRFPFHVFLETTTAGGLRSRVIVDSTKYNAAIAGRFAPDLGKIIERAVNQSERHTAEEISASPRLHDLYHVSTAESTSIRRFGEGPKSKVPLVCTHELIESRIQSCLSKVAIEDPYRNLSITYEELVDKSTKIAAVLSSCGLKSNKYVALLMDRCPEAVICMMAAWKAGGAYIPVDPTHPTSRIASILQRAKPTILLTMKSTSLASVAQDEFNGCIVMEYDELLARSHSSPTKLALQKLATDRNPTDAAYILFTSGSTGEPKGAVIPHNALVSFTLEQARVLQLTNQSRTLQIPSNSFDASVGEIVETLFAGGTLITVPKEILFSRLQEVVLRTKPTYAKFTPTVLALLPPDVDYSFETLHIGGERLTDKLLSEWGSKRNLRVLHSYGPTETVVNVCSEVLTPDSRMPVSVGKPYGNTSFCIMDPYLRIVPPTFVGDLYIGGMQLALGYIGREDLTAAAFISDPFHAEKRLYKSGDLARLRVDGSLEILGRKDGQVKIRGQRVELTEVVNVLLKHEAVAEAAVVLHDSTKQLVAYFVSRTGQAEQETEGSSIFRADPSMAFARRQLAKHAACFLPAYMVPSAFVPLVKMPLTSSAKVDLRLLQSMDLTVAISELQPLEHASPISTEIEQKLASAWAEVLSVDPTSISGSTSFAGLGGDSIAAIQLVSAARARGIGLTLSQIAGAGTLAELASKASDVPALP
ncbi:hypothetical protein DFJ73DRAFT_161789 [Zopfochytrium polystomum]|nr:hypothetical protein DFJ73DRAFT_161789 [Zopfochytrium polystomum]